jgi:hypothetical protein
MARADLVSVERIGDLLHPTEPEDAAVIAETIAALSGWMSRT